MWRRIIAGGEPGTDWKSENDGYARKPRRAYSRVQAWVPVRVTPLEVVDGKKEWQGQLISRDDTAIYLSLKGRKISIPRESVHKVLLDDNPTL